jgi:stage II sporulation protein R
MKKIIIALLLLFICALTFLGQGTQANTEYLRIHIRANSNSYVDQSVKYEIKNEVVSYLTPMVAECKTKPQALALLKSEANNLIDVVNSVLVSSGFNYKSNVVIREELFPTRVYEDFTLEEGFYDAVIIELGDAKGDNWWCVIYPPLCFQGCEKLTYKSKIVEIINDFRAKYIKEKV